MSEATQLFEAVVSGDADRVRDLLAAYPGIVDARDGDGATPLHFAAFLGHREIVALLAAGGADLNARDTKHDATPAGWAIHQMRELGGLLAIEIEDALFAIRSRDVTWARRLVTRHPALLRARDAGGKSLVEHAMESGDSAIAALFARSGRSA
jgi:ankyrin repeat protein